MSFDWRNYESRHIIPRHDAEGFDACAILSKLSGDARVVDYGCGHGRLSKSFDWFTYVGYDISVEALNMALVSNPFYKYTNDLPDPGGVLLAYTVLLHIADLSEFVEYAQGFERVIVAEIMGKSWARPDGIPPAFNRDSEWYIKRFNDAGFKLADEINLPYRYYNNYPFTFLVFDK